MYLSTVLSAVLPLSAALLATPATAGSAAPVQHPRRRLPHSRHLKNRAAAADDPLAEELYRNASISAASAAATSTLESRRMRKRSSCSAGSSAAASASASASAFASAGSSAAASASASASATSFASSQVYSASATATASSSAASASSSSTSSSPWALDLVANGTSFFDSWTFWHWDDPTHGTVDYLDSDDAWSSGLVAINPQGHAVISVDTTEVVSDSRKSIRLQSTYTFNGGLIIADFVHMPTGCGTWPAWWSNGPDWPNGGEIDILEGVNDFTQNQVSLHTSAGCTIPTDYNATATLTTGSYNSYDCGSAATSNQGCGERAESTANAYGAPFNANGGGVYAMKWDTTGISVYFFPRGSIPADITSDEPLPDTWGTPMGNFPAMSCDPFTYFKDNFAIIDNTFCGDWAGSDSVWNYAGYAGQSESCASQTGYSTCSEYVLNNGGDFSQAYWEIKSIKYYQPK